MDYSVGGPPFFEMRPRIPSPSWLNLGPGAADRRDVWIDIWGHSAMEIPILEWGGARVRVDPIPALIHRIATWFAVPATVIQAREYAAHGRRRGLDPDSSHVPVRGDDESVLPADTIATLVDLARANAERDFRELALMSGVEPAQLDELWAGTRRRLGL